MNIKEIEALTFEEMQEWANSGRAEKLNIKNHDCFLCDLGEYFGYSILVFKNGKQIYYANDYQLHHSNKEESELKPLYIEYTNNKLFTEEELADSVKDYDEHRRKSEYLRNYWIMQFDYISIFCAGNTPESERERIREQFKTMFFCNNSCCYVYDKEIVNKSNEMMKHLQESFALLKENENSFRQMISYELANHEACITCDCRDALDSLGLRYSELEDWQKIIVKEELERQINEYC